VFTHHNRTGVTKAISYVGQAAPAIAGFTISQVDDPVASPNGSNVAWTSRVTGTGVERGNDEVLYWAHEEETTLLAREGAQAAGCEEGVRLGEFLSFAIPASAKGPIFTARLKGNVVPSQRRDSTRLDEVPAKNDVGLWGVDATGRVRLLLRTGKELDGRTIQSFRLLNPGRGVPGTGRAFKGNGKIAVLVAGRDGSTHIVGVDLP